MGKLAPNCFGLDRRSQGKIYGFFWISIKTCLTSHNKNEIGVCKFDIHQIFKICTYQSNIFILYNSCKLMSDVLFRNLNEEYVQYRRDITYRTQIGVCVAEAMKKRGYARGQQKWDIFWAEKEMLDSVYHHHRIGKDQRINHFRSYHEICRKDNLNRNLKKYKRNLQRQGKIKQASEYSFFPIGYHLPLQYAIFSEEFRKAALESKPNIWIMKPTAKSQGKGIFLFNKLSHIQDWAENPEAETYVCQKYIENPLLIGGKKFDLRLYVLCTSYRPLTIYLYRQGFARFTHARYDDTNIASNQIHLTNVAIQKHTSQYSKNIGGKWMLSKLKHYLMSKYDIDSVNQSFYNIKSLVIKTLKSVSKTMSNEMNCFQLYGFDIMLDKNLKPWLIQINGSPSMRANTKKDKQLKIGIIDDVLSIIDLQKILIGTQQQIGGFDQICKKDGIVESQYYSEHKVSMLGCKLDRYKSYRQLASKLNQHYKNNQMNKKFECEPNSPLKKGFSVRKQKRGSSLVKSTQQTPMKKIGLDIPKIPNRTFTRKIYDSNVNI